VSVLNDDVLILDVPEASETLAKPLHSWRSSAWPTAEEEAYAGHLRGRLPLSGERRDEEGGGARDEGSPIHYWITSSARASTEGGMVRPSAFAVLRLITSSNLVGCSTGRSAGLAPFRILSTKTAVRR